MRSVSQCSIGFNLWSREPYARVMSKRNRSTKSCLSAAQLEFPWSKRFSIISSQESSCARRWALILLYLKEPLSLRLLRRVWFREISWLRMSQRLILECKSSMTPITAISWGSWSLRTHHSLTKLQSSNSFPRPLIRLTLTSRCSRAARWTKMPKIARESVSATSSSTFLKFQTIMKSQQLKSSS